MATGRREELIEAIQHAITEQSGQNTILSNAIAERLDVSPTELECLGVLESRGPLPAGELARQTGLTSGAVTRMIDRLVSRGAVRRREDPNDRRRVLVELTPTARHAAEPFYGPMAQASQNLLADYNARDLAVILDFLRKAHALGVEQTERVESMPESGRRPRLKFKTKILGQKLRVKI